jgi:hypothetical protein
MTVMKIGRILIGLRILPTALLLLLLLVVFPRVWADGIPPDIATVEKQWGKETLDIIHHEFSKPDSNLYYDALDGGQKKDTELMWGCGVHLSAFDAAAVSDPSYLDTASSYAYSLDRYNITFKGVEAYNPAPGDYHSPSDRYYDDNEWLILDYTDLYQLTGRDIYLNRAKKLMKFVMTGQDNKLGGGIYWHETKLESKNTCSNAPAVLSLLRLYMLTGDPSYLESGYSLYAWINATLQDPKDGLYYDNIHLDGTTEKFKLTYNTALMIRANCLFYLATGKEGYLLEARRLGQASITEWVDPKTGVLKGQGKFCHLLLDAFVDLNNIDVGNPLWLKTVDRCVAYVHDHLKDANGHYPEAWDHGEPVDPLTKWTIIDQASVARAYWAASGAYRGNIQGSSASNLVPPSSPVSNP